MNDNLDFSDLRINCNRIIRIFARNADCISDKELERIETLLQKSVLKDLTPKEEERLEELQNKRDESGHHIVNRSAQKYLWFIYLQRKFGILPRILTGYEVNPYAPNGTRKEPHVISLIENVSGIKIFRNKVRQKNDYLHGIIDAFDNEIPAESISIHEIKTTSDRIRFNFRRRYPLDKQKFLQAQGYLAISGKDNAIIHYCLLGYPDTVIVEQKELHYKRYVHINRSSDGFSEYWEKQERALVHGTIPEKDRIFSCSIDRNEEAIENIYKKVVDCRMWLNELVEFMENTKNINIVEPNKIRF